MLGAGVGLAGMALLPWRATPMEPGASSFAEAADLDVAVAAARWIRSARIETPAGATWPADPLKRESIEHDLYNGMPGVVLFHLELYHATGERRWLDEARAGAKEIVAQLPAMEPKDDCGLYTGLGGAAFVLEETHRATGDGRYRDAAGRTVASIHTHARKLGNGVGWTGTSATNDIISGTAGIGLLLLWAGRRMDDRESRALAAAAGRQLISVAQTVKGGLKWDISPDVKRAYPNFSHGTAGAAYFLATLFRATGDRAFLDAALAGAAYLQSVANTEHDGFKVFHDEPGGEQLFYLSWCHGPAGTSRLFYQLAQATGDAGWMDLVRRGARAITASGIPEQRTPGFWNNISQCCGNAGVGEYFLALNGMMADPTYAEMIQRVRTDTLRRATHVPLSESPEGAKWTQAENRVDPEGVVAQTGYMQGAAGVGTFFLHLHAASKGRPLRPIPWPDSPYA